MNTRKYPRTMSEAFGPYTSYTIEEQRADYSAGWWAWMAVCAILTLVAIGTTL